MRVQRLRTRLPSARGTSFLCSDLYCRARERVVMTFRDGKLQRFPLPTAEMKEVMFSGVNGELYVRGRSHIYI